MHCLIRHVWLPHSLTANGLCHVQIIRLSGYIADEKVNIGRKYLQPQARKDAGVPPAAIEITDQAMRDLVEEYARQAVSSCSES